MANSPASTASPARTRSRCKLRIQDIAAARGIGLLGPTFRPLAPRSLSSEAPVRARDAEAGTSIQQQAPQLSVQQPPPRPSMAHAPTGPPHRLSHAAQPQQQQPSAAQKPQQRPPATQQQGNPPAAAHAPTPATSSQQPPAGRQTPPPQRPMQSHAPAQPPRPAQQTRSQSSGLQPTAAVPASALSGPRTGATQPQAQQQLTTPQEQPQQQATQQHRGTQRPPSHPHHGPANLPGSQQDTVQPQQPPLTATASQLSQQQGGAQQRAVSQQQQPPQQEVRPPARQAVGTSQAASQQQQQPRPSTLQRSCPQQQQQQAGRKSPHASPARTATPQQPVQPAERRSGPAASPTPQQPAVPSQQSALQAPSAPPRSSPQQHTVRQQQPQQQQELRTQQAQQRPSQPRPSTPQAPQQQVAGRQQQQQHIGTQHAPQQPQHQQSRQPTPQPIPPPPQQIGTQQAARQRQSRPPTFQGAPQKASAPVQPQAASQVPASQVQHRPSPQPPTQSPAVAPSTVDRATSEAAKRTTPSPSRPAPPRPPSAAQQPRASRWASIPNPATDGGPGAAAGATASPTAGPAAPRPVVRPTPPVHAPYATSVSARPPHPHTPVVPGAANIPQPHVAPPMASAMCGAQANRATHQQQQPVHSAATAQRGPLNPGPQVQRQHGVSVSAGGAGIAANRKRGRNSVSGVPVPKDFTVGVNDSHWVVHNVPERYVGAFWDIENISVSAGNGSTVTLKNLDICLKSYAGKDKGGVIVKKAIGCAHQFSQGTLEALYGFSWTVMHTPSRKESADKSIIFEIMRWLLDRALHGQLDDLKKTCVVLITGDRDFTSLVSYLTNIGIYTVLITRQPQQDGHGDAMLLSADRVEAWEHIIAREPPSVFQRGGDDQDMDTSGEPGNEGGAKEERDGSKRQKTTA